MDEYCPPLGVSSCFLGMNGLVTWSYKAKTWLNNQILSLLTIYAIFVLWRYFGKSFSLCKTLRLYHHLMFIMYWLKNKQEKQICNGMYTVRYVVGVHCSCCCSLTSMSMFVHFPGWGIFSIWVKSRYLDSLKKLVIFLGLWVKFLAPYNMIW